MSSEAVSKALAEAKALVEALEKFDGSPEEHMSLLKKTDSVRSALEQPYDTVTRWLENMSVAGALYILIRIKALEKIPVTGSITAADLAQNCNVDVSIITRAMRVLVADGIAVETGPDEYANNDLSLALQPTALGGFACVCVDFMKTWAAVPDYVKAHQPEELYDIKKSPFSFAHGQEGKTYYEVIDSDPEQRNLWNLTLQNMEKNFPILGMYPFKNLEAQVREEPERPFVVDVGGGRGQALKAIQGDTKDAFEGKLILQDLPIVIDTLKPEELSGIELMKYDIFTLQPVENAHVYLMRRLLHDFYNPVCIEFVKNTVSAMGPTSRLIICDMLIPDRVDVGAPTPLYWLDMSLLTISGKERTKADFQEIFDAVGLELVEIYPFVQGQTVMLETRLKREAGNQ